MLRQCGNHVCSQEDPLSHLKRLQTEIFGFKQKETGTRVLPWQQYRRCHFVSFVMYSSGAKFEDHCSNISGDILNSVFYRFSGTIYDAITFLICIIQNANISKTKKDIPERKTPLFFTLKSLSNKEQLFFTS